MKREACFRNVDTRNFSGDEQERARHVGGCFRQQCRAKEYSAENHKATIRERVFRALDRKPQDQHQHEFGGKIVADGRTDREVLRHRRHQANRREREPIVVGENLAHDAKRDEQDDHAERDGEQSQRDHRRINSETARDEIHGRRGKMVQRRLVRLVANRINRHRRRKLCRFDLLQVRLVVIAALKHRQRARLRDMADVVEMRGLVRRLPFGGEEGVEGGEQDIGYKNYR